MKVVFYYYNVHEALNWENIWKRLRYAGVDARFVVEAPNRNQSNSITHAGYNRIVQYLTEHNYPFEKHRRHFDADAVVTTQTADWLRGYRGLKVNTLYGSTLTKDCWGYSRKKLRGFDLILAHGEYSKRRIVANGIPESRIAIMGFPKYVEYYLGKINIERWKARFALDAQKKTIAYLPSWHMNSSIDHFAKAVGKLSSRYNILIKPHHNNIEMEDVRIEKLKNLPGVFVELKNLHPAPFYMVSDLVLTDTRSGTLAEAILTNSRMIGLHIRNNQKADLVEPTVHKIAPICESADQLLELSPQLIESKIDDYQPIRKFLKPFLFADYNGCDDEIAAQKIIEYAERRKKKIFGFRNGLQPIIKNEDSSDNSPCREKAADKVRKHRNQIDPTTVQCNYQKLGGNKDLTELDRIIPPEIKNDSFYYAIYELSKKENIKTILEIGSSAGAGSTEAFVRGLKSNSHNPVLYCMEISKKRFAELQNRYRGEDFIKCYNFSSVSIERFPTEEEITEFYQSTKTALNEYPLYQVLQWYQQDIQYLKRFKISIDGIRKIKSENNIQYFDMVLIDGSEFTGKAELDQIYGAKIILLDDINAFKNFENYHRLKNDPSYVLFHENWHLRNGYAIFRKKNSLPIHFFTIVLNGQPFIRHHIDVFKKLPFQWYWHIVEGVAALKNDTAWSLQFGGRIENKFHRNGLSNDGTTEYLDSLAQENPGQIHIYRKPKGVFWDGKLEMVNAPLKNITEPCLLWQIDADELWTVEQVTTARQMFIDNPGKTAAYYFCHYFVGSDLITTTRDTYGNHSEYEWLRTWRYLPGDHWESHEPPRLRRPSVSGPMKDIAALHPFSHAETEKQGLVFQHFAYATEAQVRFKENYFGYKGAVQGWKRLQRQERFPVFLRNFFPWVTDETKVDRASALNLIPIAKKDPSGKWEFNLPTQQISKTRILASSIPKKILWIRTDSIGDTILSASMLPEIVKNYKAVSIFVVCQEHASEIYAACPFVDKVIGFDRKRMYSDESYQREILQRLNTLSIDLAVNSVFSSEPLTHFLTLKSGARKTIGIQGDLCNIDLENQSQFLKNYTQVCTIDSASHSAELGRHRAFLASFGIDASSLAPVIWTTSEDEHFADDFFRKNELVPEKTIALFAGAQSGIRYYFQYGRALSMALENDPDYCVLALGSDHEKTINQKNLDATGLRTFNLCGQTTIRQAAAIIKRCRLAVGAETGLAHATCAVGTPNVVLLGGGHFGRFMPYSPLTTVACLPLSCYGCNWQCRYERPYCIKDLSPHVLAEAVKAAFASASNKMRIVTQDRSSWKPAADMPEWRLPDIANDAKRFEIMSTFASAGKSLSDVLNDEGEALFARGKAENARSTFEKASAADPQDARAHNNLGVVYHRLGKEEQALAHYQKAVTLAPNAKTYQKNLADFYCVALGEIEKAMQLYVSVLRKDPRDAEALRAMGRICQALGRSTDAQSFFQRAQHADLQDEKASENPAQLSLPPQSRRSEFSIEATANGPESDYHHQYLVSAIVSTYNAERFIRGCMEDLERQTIADRLEIIVVDSGSQENEAQIVREFQQRFQNIKYIRTEQRESVYAAWNRGIKAASGKYITNANTDDRHRGDAFEVMSSILETLPEISLVYADVIITKTANESFKHCTPVGFYRWMNFNRDDLLNKGCYVGPQPMWRRQVHNEYGYFDETFVTSGDYEFWLRISQTGTFLHIPVLLGLYLKSPHSIEHANRDRQAEENRRIFKMYADAKSSGEVLGRINPPDKLPVDGSAGPKPAENVYKDVQGLIRKGEYDPAVEKLKLMTAEFPYFAPPYNDLGILYHSRGDLETALSSYQKAVELAPENATFQKNLADFYCVALGKIEAAMEIYVRVLQRDPLDIEALLAMGYICRRFERFEDAKSFYARVLEIDADNETARRFMGLAEPSRAETDDTPLSAETAYEQLLEDMQHDPLDACIAKISAFLAAFPDLAHAHSDIGALYQRAGASDKAEKHLQKAALLAKDNPQFQKNLADFYLVERDRKEPALEIYRRLLDKDPGNKQLLLLAGHVCVALKRLSDAAVFYRRLLAEDPGNTDARTNLEAIEGIEEAHDKKSPPPGKTPRGKVLQEPGDGSTAQLDAAPAEGPDDPQVSILISASGPVNRLRSRVQAIERHTDTPYELIFLDSGVTKGTDQWLQQFLDQNDHGHRIRCGHATNAATAVNAGIAASHSKMILRLSNDVEVTPGWLASMITHLERNADTGIVGAMSNVAAERQKAPLPWSKGEDTLAKFAAAYRQRNRHRRIPANTIDGFCMLFTRQLFENIGPFDEELGQGGYDGEDFCLRATLAGCQNLIAGDVYLHRHLKKKPPRDKKAFTLKWSGADVKTPAGKKYLALLTERKARRAWQAERVDEAGELFLQAIGLQPESCKSYHRLAEMLIQTKQYENALEVLNELPEGEPDVREIVLKACCQEGLGRLEEAQQLVDRALEINPLFAPALNRKGLLAYQHSDRHNAGGWFQRALAADPGFGEAYTNLGALKWEAGEKDAALELYERAFILEPAVADIAANYHAAMSDLNQYARGVPILREAVSAYPFSKKIRYMLIDCLIRLQQYAAAMETIESAIADFGIEDGILASALKVREILGPLEIESHDPNHPTVSLCMITKNEQEHLARCLRSAKPVVDEIIVTDTGSNDRSIDIARAFGAKVNAFAWTEDFSAARNDALSQATGGVIFVMDADEVISPTDYPEFRRIARQSGTKRCAYIVNTRNYTMDNNLVSWVANDGCYGAAEAGTGWTPSAKIRIFPNDRGVRFDFPVHEMVEPSLEKAGIPMLACDIQIHHYGKLNSQKSRTKGEAYYEIGRKKLAETKDAPVALRELATQAEILGKHDESIELWKRFIALLPNEPKAYINMGITYCSLGQFDNVLATAEKVLQLRPESKEGHYNYALAKLHLGCPEQARETLKELCHRMPEYLPARFLMAATHCVMGKKDTGMAMLAELSRTSIGPGLAIRCHELAKAFAANNRFDYARSLLDAAIDSKNSNKNILNLYADCLEHIDSDKKTGTYE